MIVTLPWPDSRLSPNARGHWAVVAKAKKSARETAAWLTKAATPGVRYWTPLDVKVTFRPPDNRARDTDNMVASVKAYLDGVADALGVDDSRWTLTIERAAPVKGGAVVVEISTGA